MIQLNSNETVIGVYRPHWVTLMRWTPFVGVAAAFFTMGVSLLLLLPSFVRYMTDRYYVTTHRLVVVSGFITKDQDSLMRGKVESVEVDRHITGTLLGYGEVTIHGTGGRMIRLGYVKNPGAFEAALAAL